MVLPVCAGESCLWLCICLFLGGLYDVALDVIISKQFTLIRRILDGPTREICQRQRQSHHQLNAKVYRHFPPIST